jgi:GT2 family glycosyltransferase
LISIIVLTHNRVHLLRQCVENVLARTSPQTREIVVWDNDSTDGTREYLDALDDPRLRVVHHTENVGMNAKRRAAALTTCEYLLEVDDDVVDAPPEWDAALLDAFRRLPEIGYLAASIAFDPDDAASQYLKYMREERKAYAEREVDGIRILEGPVGGACTMTSRELYERVGGFEEHRKLAYWHTEEPYMKALRKLGYRSAFLEGLEVRHAGGPAHGPPPAAKVEYHRHAARVRARKNLVKRVLLALPGVAALNDRHRWFDPPAPDYTPPPRES